MQSELVDSVVAMQAFLDGLPNKSGSVNLFVNLEGNKLSRDGTLSLLTMFVESEKKVYLIDGHTLARCINRTHLGQYECALRMQPARPPAALDSIE